MGLTPGMLLTLGNALSCSRYQNLMHRYTNLVEIAIRSNLSDSFGSGVIQPGPGWLYRSPTYYSQTLYQRTDRRCSGVHAGRRPACRRSEAMNTHDDPNRISMSGIDAAIKGSLIEYAFEPLTVTLIECSLRRLRLGEVDGRF
jgi:hypothetical protein